MSFPNSHYQFNSSILDDEKILTILKKGSIDELKKIVKINKKLEMVYTNEKENGTATDRSTLSIVNQKNKDKMKN